MKSLVLVAAMFLAGLAYANPPVCTSAPKSCGEWSPYYDVGAPYCGMSRICDGEMEPTAVRVTLQKQEQFHVCFYNDGTQCIESSQKAVELYCGCY
jgi:hypothetical protein